MAPLFVHAGLEAVAGGLRAAISRHGSPGRGEDSLSRSGTAGLSSERRDGIGRADARRCPEDVNLHRILLLSLVDNEACVHGREVADWLAEHASGDYDCLRALLLYALGYLDLELAGRVAAR